MAGVAEVGRTTCCGLVIGIEVLDSIKISNISADPNKKVREPRDLRILNLRSCHSLIECISVITFSDDSAAVVDSKKFLTQ
jgi:hypothetical protein